MDLKNTLATAAVALLAAAALLPASTLAELEPALPTCQAGPLYDLDACSVRVAVGQAEPGAPLTLTFLQGSALSCSGANEDVADADAAAADQDAAADPPAAADAAAADAGEPAVAIDDVAIQPLDFSADLECSPLQGLGTVDARNCVAVAAGTDTSGPASASASSSCGSLSASCSSSSGLFTADHCHDEDTGASSGGWSCHLRISWTPGLGSASAWCSVSAS